MLVLHEVFLKIVDKKLKIWQYFPIKFMNITINQNHTKITRNKKKKDLLIIKYMQNFSTI